MEELNSADHVFIVKNFKKTARLTIDEPVFLKLLSRYVDLDQANIKVSAEGKPYIDSKTVHFSIAHSGDILVLVFSKNLVGIDIEQEKPRNFARLGRKYGFVAENVLDFYRAWTAREALIKLKGGTIAKDLARIKVAGNQAFIDNTSATLIYFEVPGFYAVLAQEKPKKGLIFDCLTKKSYEIDWFKPA